MSRKNNVFDSTQTRDARLNYLVEGVDHINIGENSVTDLGKMLSLDANIGFDHPIFGKFKTLRGYWYYISCGQNKEDRFRYLTGVQLFDLYKRTANQLRNKNQSFYIKNFKAIILEGCYLKMIQNQQLHDLVFDNIIDIDCYSTLPSGLRKEYSYSRWWITGVRLIIRAIQTGKAPDYKLFMETDKEDMYMDVLPNYFKHALNEKARQEEIEALERHLQQNADQKTPDLSENLDVETNSINDDEDGREPDDFNGSVVSENQEGVVQDEQTLSTTEWSKEDEGKRTRLTMDHEWPQVQTC